MNESLSAMSSPDIPCEVLDFAAENGVGDYLNAVIDLGREAFPSSAVHVSLGQDAEDEMHQYVALDVEVSGKTTEEILSGQRIWSTEISRICPPRYAVYFVLGWR